MTHPPHILKMLETIRMGAGPPQRDSIPESIVGALLSVAESGNSADWWIVNALTSIQLDYEQHCRLVGVIKRGEFGPHSSIIHVDSKLASKLAEEYEDRLGFLPPSYMRHVIVDPNAPRIEKKVVDKYVKKGNRVFTEALITGSSVIRKDLTNRGLGAMLEVCGDCSPVTEKIFGFTAFALENSQLYASHIVSRMALMEDTEFRENLHQIAVADAHRMFARQVMELAAKVRLLFSVEPIMRALDVVVDKDVRYGVLEEEGLLDGKRLPALLIVVRHSCNRFSSAREDGEKKMIDLARFANSHAVSAMLERGFQEESLSISLSGAE